MLVHPKTTHVLCEQPSVVCLWTGVAHLVDQDEPGFKRLSSTSSSTTSASTRRGSVRRTVPSGVNSWRQLCPVKYAPPDDDDDDRHFVSRAVNAINFQRTLYRLLVSNLLHPRRCVSVVRTASSRMIVSDLCFVHLVHTAVLVVPTCCNQLDSNPVNLEATVKMGQILRFLSIAKLNASTCTMNEVV